MEKKKKILLLLLTAGMLLLFVGCGKEDAVEAENQGLNQGLKIEEAAPAIISTEVSELYQSQTLMMEMLVNEDCVIEDTGDTLMVSTPDGFAQVGISFIPGIQNLGATAELIPAVLESNNAVPEEVKDGVIFGERAKHCTYSLPDGEGGSTEGFFATAIVNSSLYMLDVEFAMGCTDEDGELITNVFSSMNILTPTSVDQEAKTATYETKYPEAKPAKAAEKTYQPVTEWVYLPYYYYAWDYGFDYSVYDSLFYEPDWNYYTDGNWWSWSWDDDGSWGFYDEYGDWYAEDYYSYYDDYYDYDPYSDPGDYYDYDPYSDPGDYYYEEEYSDPGDYYYEEEYSDPGDYYEEEYSDPGDYYYEESYDDYGDY
ncbi:MAG: hypothetical protein QM697_06135 [Lachnospiraceae bacterium]